MIKRQSVVFNLADPDQLRMYQHANKRTNFSAYIKRLIQRDMESYQQVTDKLNCNDIEQKEPEDNDVGTALIDNFI